MAIEDVKAVIAHVDELLAAREVAALDAAEPAVRKVGTLADLGQWSCCHWPPQTARRPPMMRRRRMWNPARKSTREINDIRERNIPTFAGASEWNVNVVEPEQSSGRDAR